MNPCAFCQTPLAAGPPWAPGPGHRLAFDPRRGRLWTVCPTCRRWNLTPMADRWETLEACERAVRDTGQVQMSTPNLSLIRVAQGELILVGAPPRLEFVDWRYGPRLPVPRIKQGFWARLLARLLSRLPEPPPEGYDPYRGYLGAVDRSPWLASPFLDSASSLSYLFSHVPLAPSCPSCARPLALRPWQFQRVRLSEEVGIQSVLAPCAFCDDEVGVPLIEARPVIRLGLGLVTPPPLLQGVSHHAASALEGSGRPLEFIRSLSRSHSQIGELDLPNRAGLLIALDEAAEIEALEAEWQKAEELAAISDGELSIVPGFDAFRREVLGDFE